MYEKSSEAMRGGPLRSTLPAPTTAAAASQAISVSLAWLTSGGGRVWEEGLAGAPQPARRPPAAPRGRPPLGRGDLGFVAGPLPRAATAPRGCVLVPAA